MLRFTKILALSVVVLALGFGCAWAAVDYDAPYAYWGHTSYGQIVDGKTDFSPSDPNAYQPQFRWMYLYVANVPLQNGTITVNVKHNTIVDYEDYNGDNVWSEELAGQKTFPLWSVRGYDYLSTGDDSGNEAVFGLKDSQTAETAFSEQPFSFNVADVNVSGIFPVFHTTEIQLAEKCVPYIELIADSSGKNLIAVRWRFVDVSETTEIAVKKNDSNYNVRYFDTFDIRFKDSGRSTIYEHVGAYFEIDDRLEGEKALTASVPIDEILYIRPRYTYDDSVTNNAEVHYSWRFYLSATVTPPTPTDPTQPNPEKPSDTDIENAVNAANSNLAEPPTEMKAAETTNITTGTNVTFANSEVKARTSSVIAVNQSVTEGGAVVLGTSMTLPINSQSLSGVNLPQPADFNDLAGKYQVLKYFENGGSIDLLWKFGNKIFSYSPTTGVTMHATIIVIDGPAPITDTDIYRPSFGDGKYGVKLSRDNKYLYVYDGIIDGIAKDPIALVQVEDDGGDDGGDDGDNNNGGGGSSSGCNTGFFAILTLIAVPLVSRKK